MVLPWIEKIASRSGSPSPSTFHPPPNYELFNCSKLKIRSPLELSGAGTRLFLQLILVGFFKSISLQSNTLLLANICCQCLQLCWFLKSLPSLEVVAISQAPSPESIIMCSPIFWAKFKNWKNGQPTQPRMNWRIYWKFLDYFLVERLLKFRKKLVIKIDFYLLFYFDLRFFWVRNAMHRTEQLLMFQSSLHSFEINSGLLSRGNLIFRKISITIRWYR